MRCERGHDHPPEPFKASTGNKTRPHGPRPYHCPDCQEVHKAGKKQGNWETYTSMGAAIRAGHIRPCSICLG